MICREFQANQLHRSTWFGFASRYLAFDYVERLSLEEQADVLGQQRLVGLNKGQPWDITSPFFLRQPHNMIDYISTYGTQNLQICRV